MFLFLYVYIVFIMSGQKIGVADLRETLTSKKATDYTSQPPPMKDDHIEKVSSSSTSYGFSNRAKSLAPVNRQDHRSYRQPSQPKQHPSSTTDRSRSRSKSVSRQTFSSSRREESRSSHYKYETDRHRQRSPSRSRARSLAPEDFRRNQRQPSVSRRVSTYHRYDTDRHQSATAYYTPYRGGHRSSKTEYNIYHSSRHEEYDPFRPLMHTTTKQEHRPRHEEYDPSRPSMNPKQLFLAAHKNTFGMMMDKEYDVFDIQNDEDENFVAARTSWALRMAMYQSNQKICSKYMIHRYAASKGFIVSVLTNILKENSVKLYTTVQTTDLIHKRFASVEGYDVLKKELERLEALNMYDNDILKPQRRSSVCLFRPNCIRKHECVYCQLETLNNRVNLHSGVRATKETDTGEHDRGLLDKTVNKVASKKGSQKKQRCTSPSSNSSTSTSSTKSSSSSTTATYSSSSDDDRNESYNKKCERIICEESGVKKQNKRHPKSLEAATPKGKRGCKENKCSMVKESNVKARRLKASPPQKKTSKATTGKGKQVTSPVDVLDLDVHSDIEEEEEKKS